MLVLLDTNYLGMLTNPNANAETRALTRWLVGLQKSKIDVKVPAVSDYEIRRSLILNNSKRGISKLDFLNDSLGYVRITKGTMKLAAQFWADLRKIGLPTDKNERIDADVILAAQAITEQHRPENQNKDVIIATDNDKHLSRMTKAAKWKSIKP